MPIYEYICEDCQTHFEKIVLNKTQEIACPKCAGKKNAIKLFVRRVLWRWRQLLRRRMRLQLNTRSRDSIP
jgi:putative FmdB family regulatory protein